MRSILDVLDYEENVVPVTPEVFCSIQELCDKYNCCLLSLGELVEGCRKLGFPVDQMMYKNNILQVVW